MQIGGAVSSLAALWTSSGVESGPLGPRMMCTVFRRSTADSGLELREAAMFRPSVARRMASLSERR